MNVRRRILMVAYACDPQGGGEHWLGWGWAREASRYHDITLLTTSRGAAPLRTEAKAHGIELYEVSLPAWIRHLSEHAGSIGVWWRKILWQNQAFTLAKSLHQQRPFELVHQTTFHTFRVPFSCAGLGIPSVWGPIAGGETVPSGFEPYLGTFAKQEARRTKMNRLCLRLPSIRSSLSRTDAILVSNRTTLEFLPPEFQVKCQIVPPNALRMEDVGSPRPEPSPDIPFEIIFAGACAPTRALSLVFEALAAGISSQWTMTTAGSGPALPFWKSEAVRLNIAEHIHFLGSIPREELVKIYHRASVLVFPALRDSGGSALLEAMTLGIPILTFNWAGPGEMVDDTCAILVPVNNPADTVEHIRTGLARLANDRNFSRALATSARIRALTQFSWKTKFQPINHLYKRLTA